MTGRRSQVWMGMVLAGALGVQDSSVLGQEGGAMRSAQTGAANASAAASASEARAAAVGDDPDAALEQGIEPIPSEQRAAPARARQTRKSDFDGSGGTFSLGADVGSTPGNRPDAYTIQNGDTLWSISGQFWGDSFFWPSLWSYNPYIGNAHLIYPGNTLRFTPGSYVRPPGMDFGQEGAAEPGEVVETTGTEMVVANVTDTSCGPEIPFLERVGSFNVRSIGFLREQGFGPLGKIVKAPESKELLTERDLVYVQFNRMSDVKCGDVYTIYEASRKRVPHPVFKGRVVGSLYRILGELEITDVNDFAATARIRGAYSEIERGALVTTLVPVDHRVSIQKSSKELDGYIVETLNQEASTLGINDVIYIDRGEQDSVASGDAFYVVRQGNGVDGQWRRGAKDVTMPYHVVGRVVVVEPGEYVSQAVITEASGVIEIGDHITTQVD